MTLGTEGPGGTGGVRDGLRENTVEANERCSQVAFHCTHAYLADIALGRLTVPFMYRLGSVTLGLLSPAV